MKKRKLLLALTAMGIAACAFAFTACSTNDGADNNDKPNAGIGDNDTPNIGIDDPYVPLGPTGCAHTGAVYTAAVEATCTTAGNTAYWHCADCGKYFANATLSVETSLAAVTLTATGHNSLTSVVAVEATCTTAGNIAHSHCADCGTNFDADNKVITDVVIPASGHDVTPHAAVAATCVAKGNIAYWHCATCGNDYDSEELDHKVTTTVTEIDAKNHDYGELHPEIPAANCHGGMHAYYECSLCKSVFDSDKEATIWPWLSIPAKHNLEYSPAEDATCTDWGYDECWYCVDCDLCFADEFGIFEVDFMMYEPLGHEFGERIDGEDATCTTDGEIAHYHCEVCGLDYDEDENEIEDVVIPAGHSFGEWIKETPVTCEANGEKAHYHCATCNKDYDEDENEIDDVVIAAIGHHEYGDWISATSATCEEAGEEGHYHCDNCGTDFDDDKKEIEDIVIPATGHSYSNWVNETPAQCEAYGEKAHYHCNGCGKYFDSDKKEIDSLVIPMSGHNKIMHIEAVGATCTSGGNIEYWYCSACGTYFSDEELTVKTTADDVVLGANPDNHDYGDWIEEYPATCEGAGEMAHYHCNDCDKDFDAEYKELTEIEIPANGHDYGELIGKEATCTEMGVVAHYHCAACDTDFDENKEEITYLGIAALDHEYGKWTAEVPATCEEDGVEGYYHCARCEKYLDAEGKELYSLGIDKKGHDYNNWIYETPATCTEAGEKEHYHCVRCNKNLAQGGAEIEDLVIPVNGNHKYGEFEYDYTATKYVKTCANDSTHTVEQAAGTEEYPYLATNASTLQAAVNKGGYAKLVEDIDCGTSNVFIDNTVETFIDLNGHTVSGLGQVVFYLGYNNVPAVTISNGNIVATASNGMAVYSVKSVTTLRNVNITSALYGVYASAGTITINGGQINASGCAVQGYSAKYYASQSAPATIEDYDLIVNIQNANIISETANSLGINMRSARLTVSDTKIDTNSTCVMIYRDTVVTMTDCEMKSVVGCGVQGNGTTAVANYNCGIDTVVTLNNCTIEATTGIYHPQVGGELTVNGGTVTASAAGVEVRAGSATLNNVAVECTAETFEIESNKNGSTVKNGAAVVVSQHTTDAEISVTLNGCELTGVYALYEKDVQNATATENISVILGEGNTFNGYIYSQNCQNIIDMATADENGNSIAA